MSLLPKKYRTKKNPPLSKRRGVSGLGLFANESIGRKEFVIEYTGDILTGKEADARGGKYLFETSKNRFIDGSARTNLARYINHSCDPNCEIEIRKGRIYVFSIRKITAGEELTYDYQQEYFDEHIGPFGCRCSARKHRTMKKALPKKRQ